MYDIIVVGAGISGAVLAQKYASERNKSVLVIDKRDHIGGNCYDYFNRAGILVPKYGPHFFHTNDEGVWEYVSRFTKWHPFEHRVFSYVDKMFVPMPVNIDTINKLLRLSLDETTIDAWLESVVEKIDDPKNSEESAVSRVGRVLYEKLLKNYTKKHWDLWPSELDASVMNRIPVRPNYDDRYFSDIHQGMPKDGYTKLFERMFHYPGISIQLNTDFFDVKDKLKGYEKLFYTGPIDRFFEYRFSDKDTLQYRSVNFKHQTLNKEFFQPRVQVNYPNERKFTRIIEPKHATGQKHPKTTIIREYSTWEGEPYYPVPNPKNQRLFDEYRREAAKLKNIFFVGRLANYKYFNMDQAFRNAMDMYETLEEGTKVLIQTAQGKKLSI